MGVAHADEIQVDGVYSTLAACEADGPHAQLAVDDHIWTHWDCRQHEDGLYYLYFTN